MPAATRRLGVILPLDVDVREFAVRSEEAGFHVFGCGEHVFFATPVYNSFIALSVAASATETIRLASTVCLLPLYPAPLVAKMVAELDRLSGGRYIFGVGVGGESGLEFDACGVPLAGRGALVDQSLETIDRLLRGVALDLDDTDGVAARIDPAPVQRPRPPIWIAGRRQPAMRRAARFGDGWIPHVYTPAQLRDSIATIGKLSEEMSHGEWTGTASVILFYAVDRDRATAEGRAFDTLRRWYGTRFARAGKDQVVAGDPDDVAVRVEEYFAAGAETVFLSPLLSRADVPGMFELTSTELMPRLSLSPRPAPVLQDTVRVATDWGAR